jgi:mannose-1-phosphate guanylyltransferase/phosphomannomutase
MALKNVNTRFEYGVTLTDSKSRITKFFEKPLWGDIFSNQVNTGIYVFNKEIFRFIPPNRFYDFGSQVWPELLKKRKPIYGFNFNHFWTDIGNIQEYHHAQHAVLNKELNTAMDLRELRPKVWMGSGTKLGSGVKLEAPCMIGNHCIIGKNATIGAGTVIGDDSKIGNQSVIKNSILWGRVQVANQVRMNHCAIGMNVKISNNIPFLQGIVLNIS